MWCVGNQRGILQTIRRGIDKTIETIDTLYIDGDNTVLVEAALAEYFHTWK